VSLVVLERDYIAMGRNPKGPWVMVKSRVLWTAGLASFVGALAVGLPAQISTPAFDVASKPSGPTPTFAAGSCTPR
jgi:hypothetical protein